MSNVFVTTSMTLGSAQWSILTEAQFQGLNGTGCVLADGRSCVGSLYETLTGSSTVPNLCGLYLRGKNNGRSDGKEDPDGEVALGTYQADRNVAHTHVENAMNNTGGGAATIVADANGNTPIATSLSTASSGSADARPRSMVGNWFFRIN